MSHTITIDDELYERLSWHAARHGYNSIESWLEDWHTNQEDRKNREEAVRRIDELRERLAARYGKMPDSVPLIREDRER